MAKSFFSTLESELLEPPPFTSQAKARKIYFSYIVGWYKPAHLRSRRGFRSPMTYEAEKEEALIET